MKKEINKYGQIYSKRIQGIEIAKKQHQEAEKIIENLKIGNTMYIRDLLLRHNKGIEEAGPSRTLVLMDATGSMTQLLEKSKSTVVAMFDLLHETLKEKNYDENGFQIMFAVYRNYSSPYDKLLESSEWTSQSSKLQTFLNKVNVQGGQGNEAIEVGLNLVLKEHNKTDKGIDQVILIGDAPSNSDQETNRKRKGRGENYWSQYPEFAQPVYTSKLIPKIVNIRHSYTFILSC